jgi:hypothetical protein
MEAGSTSRATPNRLRYTPTPHLQGTAGPGERYVFPRASWVIYPISQMPSPDFPRTARRQAKDVPPVLPLDNYVVLSSQWRPICQTSHVGLTRISMPTTVFRGSFGPQRPRNVKPSPMTRMFAVPLTR